LAAKSIPASFSLSLAKATQLKQITGEFFWPSLMYLPAGASCKQNEHFAGTATFGVSIFGGNNEITLEVSINTPMTGMMPTKLKLWQLEQYPTVQLDMRQQAQLLG
jgi:hypothetical protein